MPHKDDQDLILGKGQDFASTPGPT